MTKRADGTTREAEANGKGCLLTLVHSSAASRAFNVTGLEGAEAFKLDGDTEGSCVITFEKYKTRAVPPAIFAALKDRKERVVTMERKGQDPVVPIFHIGPYEPEARDLTPEDRIASLEESQEQLKGGIDEIKAMLEGLAASQAPLTQKQDRRFRSKAAKANVVPLEADE